MANTHPKVFISYSHKDKDWVCDWLLPKLENSGIKTHIDFRDFEFGIPSVINMERAVEQCAKTMLIFTPSWVESEFSQFEGIMLQTGDPIGSRKKILPLMLNHCELPPRLKMFTYADFRDKSNWDFQIERVIEQIKKDFVLIEEPPTKFPVLADENVDITRLPGTGYELFGRQKELKILNEAWDSGTINVLSFVAYGGVGKSTLVNKWLEKMRWDNYRGAKRVYGWSFYSQGTNERVTSADRFISEALTWFGDKETAESSKSAWDKGQRLAELVQQQKTLLILDGLEPLQSIGDFERGKIKDPALSTLITQLARKNNGLCIITTREKIAELTRFNKGIEQLNLDQITKDAGGALLWMGGVVGTDAQLESASEAFGNHALAVNLLASFLYNIAGHHISNASQIEDLDIPEEKGRHARRVIEAFEKRFGEGSEVQLLRILGFFDRPVEIDAMRAVYDGSPIERLTDKLVNLTDVQWQNLFEKLRRCKLLAKKSTHRPDVIDCHPLVREHFGEKLKNEKTEAWKEGHRRLYEYYKGVPKKELPDTLEEMDPLFRSVYHGCQAEKHQEVYDKIYLTRILRRGHTYYIVRQLGAFSSWLSILSCFFDEPWRQVATQLKESDAARTLSNVGSAFQAVGRLREAVEPMEVSIHKVVVLKDWKNAAEGAGNMSELNLTIGEVGRAIEYGQKSVEYADRDEYMFLKIVGRATLADALHQTGRVDEAKRLFEEAEEIQKKEQPGCLYLYSLRGYQYCDLLLELGRIEDVKKRAEKILEWTREMTVSLLARALHQLSLGKAYLMKYQISKRKIVESPEVMMKKKTLRQAHDWLNKAVTGLRGAGYQDYIPVGLFTRAEMFTESGDFKSARRDLDEAREIAEQGEMKLWLVDAFLVEGRLHLAQGQKDKAKECGEKAKKLINETGYHRRDKEAEELYNYKL